MKIDHLMWACPDLNAGMQEVADLTGISAEFSGQHKGLGTRNALLSLGKDCYLEIIAPDPEQTLENNFGARLANLKHTGLLSWAMAVAGLGAYKATLAAAGIESSPVQTTTRENQSGELLTWELLFVQGITDAPFFIDWLNCAHPAKTSPAGCALVSLAVPQNSIDGLASDVPQLKFGTELKAEISTPEGIVELVALNEKVRLF